MFKDTNVFVLGGNLTSEPETKTIGGQECVKFRIASENGIKEGPNMNTIYLDCEWWNPSKGAQYLGKGKKVELIGRLTMSHWADKETGLARSRFVFKVSQLELRGKKNDSNSQLEPDSSSDFLESLKSA